MSESRVAMARVIIEVCRATPDPVVAEYYVELPSRHPNVRFGFYRPGIGTCPWRCTDHRGGTTREH